jgi:hypothetical protein
MISLALTGSKKAKLVKGKKLKLVYFGIPALGEPLRLLLALGNFDWEDVKVTHGHNERELFEKHIDVNTDCERYRTTTTSTPTTQR